MSQAPAPTPSEQATGDRRLPILLAMAMFVLVVDTSIMNVSISAVVADLGTDVSAIQSAIALEALVSAAFILIGSKIGDLFGRKRAYILGLLAYAVGALAMALSPDRAADLHLLGRDRWPRRLPPAARDAVAHPRQLRGGGPEGDLCLGRGRRCDRGGDRTTDRRLHHHIPVVSSRLPARGRSHRRRAARQPACQGGAVHRPSGDRPRRGAPVGPRNGRPGAEHPRLAGGWRGGRPAPGDRRCLARGLRLLAASAGSATGSRRSSTPISSSPCCSGSGSPGSCSRTSRSAAR